MGHGQLGSSRSRRWVGVLPVVALLLAGCPGGGDEGGGGGGTAAGGGTTAGSVTTTAATAPPSTSETGTDPARIARARNAVFSAADFPPGFTPRIGAPHPHPQGEGEGLDLELIWQDITTCVGVRSTAQPAGVATSPTFLMGLATQAQSTVEYTTEAAAAATATALAGPKFNECAITAFTEDLKRNAPQGATPGPVQVTPREAPPAGQRSSAWRVNASVNLADLPVPLFQDFLVIFNGGTVIRMLFLNPGAEFPQTLERSLVDKVVSRA